MSVPAVGFRDFQVVFKGDLVGRIEDAEEVLIGDIHYIGKDQQGLDLEHALDLVKDGDAFFMEGVSLFARQKCFDHLMGTDLPVFKFYGWDYNEDGAEVRGDFVPEYWRFYENEARLVNELANASEGAKREALQKELTVYQSHPQRDQFRAQAFENWNKRQASLVDALTIAGTLRSLNGRVLQIGDKKLSLDPSLVFKRAVIQSGLAHVMKTAVHPELAPSVDRLYAFLKKRNAVVLVHKMALNQKV
jgi:hypothetical protein